MTDTLAPAVPAGWYPDPAGSADMRWWDGASWTSHTANSTPAVDVAPALRSDPAGGDHGVGATMIELGDPTTRWAWLLVFSPFIWAAVTGASQAALFTTMPPDSGGSVPAIGVFTLIVGLIPGWVFAALDRRELLRRNYDSPPSVLWMLLIPPFAYLLRRRRALQLEGVRARGIDIATLIMAILAAIQLLASLATLVIGLSFLIAATAGPTEAAQEIPPGTELQSTLPVGEVDPASPMLERDVADTIADYTSMNDTVDCTGALSAMTTGAPFACMMTDLDAEVTWPVYAQVWTDGTVVTGSLPSA